MYTDNKKERQKQSEKHYNRMKEMFNEQIKYSVDNTIKYSKECTNCNDIKNNKEPEIKVLALDTVSAIAKANSKNTAILNFASYKNPGGGFLNGSRAQEECLCAESNLYNILECFTNDFYEWNRNNTEKGLYLNRALYTPRVMFRDGRYVCDVITCAAPNKAAAIKYGKLSERENSSALNSRIKFILDIADKHKVEVLILGAFGCGVFGQDATEVAKTFKKYLDSGRYKFNTVIFAIPKGKDRNFELFKQVFNK